MPYTAYEVFVAGPVMESLAQAVMNLEDPYGWRTWLQLCLALPQFGRYSLSHKVQRKAMNAFTRKEGNDGDFCIMYKLPNWWLHRDHDQPAEVRKDGKTHWYVAGKLHRDNDLPAEISEYGTKMWWKNGKRHRDHGRPAIVKTCGDKYWFVNGERYRPNELPTAVEVNYKGW